MTPLLRCYRNTFYSETIILQTNTRVTEYLYFYKCLYPNSCHHPSLTYSRIPAPVRNGEENISGTEGKKTSFVRPSGFRFARLRKPGANRQVPGSKIAAWASLGSIRGRARSVFGRWKRTRTVRNRPFGADIIFSRFSKFSRKPPTSRHEDDHAYCVYVFSSSLNAFSR